MPWERAVWLTTAGGISGHGSGGAGRGGLLVREAGLVAWFEEASLIALVFLTSDSNGESSIISARTSRVESSDVICTSVETGSGATGFSASLNRLVPSLRVSALSHTNCGSLCSDRGLALFDPISDTLV